MNINTLTDQEILELVKLRDLCLELFDGVDVEDIEEDSVLMLDQEVLEKMWDVVYGVNLLN